MKIIRILSLIVTMIFFCEIAQAATNGRCTEKPELPGRTEHGKIVQYWINEICGSKTNQAQCTDRNVSTSPQCQWINNTCSPVDCNRMNTRANCLIPGVPARCQWK
mgnify:CR=1 FL=1